MAVRSVIFVVQGSHLPKAQVSTLYTCPVGRTAIVKEFSLVNGSGVAAYAAIGIRRAAATVWIEVGGALPANSKVGGGPRHLVLQPGDQLAAYFDQSSGSSSYAYVYAAGALLDGVAS